MNNKNSTLHHVPNFTIDDERTQGDTLEAAFDSWVNNSPSLINIFPLEDSRKTSAEEQLRYYNEFGEEPRKGGLGKTLLLNRLLGLYQQQTGLKKMQVLDLSGGQFNTKQNIIDNIAEQLDSNIFPKEYQNWVHSYRKRTQRLIAITPEGDPSFIAEKSCFDAASECFSDNPPHSGEKVPFVIVDGFDRIHIGDKNNPLRTWLSEDLFPFLIKRMKVSVLVAGRDKVNSPDTQSYEDISTIGIKVHAFDEEQVKDYVKKILDKESEGNQLLGQITSDHWKNITIYSGGKPIFLDLFCSILMRDCFKIKSPVPFTEFWSRIIPPDPSLPVAEQTYLFKKFLVNRLYLHDNPEKDQKYRTDIQIAIQLLSIAKTGLTPEQFVFMRDGKKNLQNLTEFETDQIRKFYEDFFLPKGALPSKGFSYIKQRVKSDGIPVRLLHDEFIELIQEYYWNEKDPDHKIRNIYIGRLANYYEENLLQPLQPSGVTNDKIKIEYIQFLLEYLLYILDYRDHDKERAALNRLYYEFSYYLDRSPDVCRMVLGRGLRYFKLKRAAAYYKLIKSENADIATRHEGELTNTLMVSTCLDEIIKIPMREIMYLLTERPSDWKNSIKTLFGQINELLDEKNGNEYAFPLDKERRKGVDARIKTLEIERDLWIVPDAKPLKKGRLAQQEFGQLGDYHGVDWVEHLIGFDYQREANFQTARHHHNHAITNTIRDLRKHALPMLRYPEDFVNDFRRQYQLLLIIKTLLRAGGNLAVNLRYQGHLLSGLRKIETFYPLAPWIGDRERSRLNINRIQFHAIRGKNMDEERGKEKPRTLGLNDPLLPRRLALAELIQVTKQEGSEDAPYRSTADTFLPKSSEKISEQIEKLEKSFKLRTRWLSIEEEKKNRNARNIWEKWEQDEKSSAPNRELADIYYQYGKLVLTYLAKGEDSWNIAATAFENCIIVAREVRFYYLELQASEALARLYYLKNDKWNAHIQLEYFKTKSVQLKNYGYESGNLSDRYRPYYDLLSKYHLTKGDTLRTEAPDRAIGSYLRMLWSAFCHNQIEYHFALECFCDRLRSMKNIKDVVRIQLRGMNNPETDNAWYAEQKELRDRQFQFFYKKTETFLEQWTELYQDDDFLKKPEQQKSYKGYLKSYMKSGDFIKAGLLNELWLDKFASNDKSEERAIRLFQHFYIYQWSDRRNKAKEITDQMLSLSNDEHTSAFWLVYAVTYATWLYRDMNTWTFEKYLYEEMVHTHKHNFTENVELAEQLFKESIKILIQKHRDTPEQLSGPMYKVLIAAIFRLGELLLLTDQAAQTSLKEWKEIFSPLFSFSLFTDKKDKLNTRHVFLDEMSPALYVLNIAYWLAEVRKEKHRALDALQSIANVRYLQGETIIPETEADRRTARINILEILNRKVREQLIDKHNYPILRAKLENVEADVYFSQIFKLEVDKNGVGTKAELRDSKSIYSKEVRTTIRKMVHALLDGLNALAVEEDAAYRTFHFNNMLLEINRRIRLIRNRDAVLLIKEEIEQYWEYIFPINTDHLIRDSILQDIDLHEATLLIEEVMANYHKGGVLSPISFSNDLNNMSHE